MNKAKAITLILLTPIFILLSHYIGYFIHEYAHSSIAWILGYKNNPFDIHYGDTSWVNLFLLDKVQEDINYKKIFSEGNAKYVALIAFAGIGFGNGLLYVLSLFLIKSKNIIQKTYLFYFLFWLNFIQVANFYAYVPIRTFGTHGDMANLAAGLNISPWWIYIILGYPIAFIIGHFFTKTLSFVFINLPITRMGLRASLMIICVLIFFGYFGLVGFLSYGEISHFLSATSFIAIPGVILMCWPKRILDR